jgi:hypothetical protein
MVVAYLGWLRASMNSLTGSATKSLRAVCVPAGGFEPREYWVTCCSCRLLGQFGWPLRFSAAL